MKNIYISTETVLILLMGGEVTIKHSEHTRESLSFAGDVSDLKFHLRVTNSNLIENTLRYSRYYLNVGEVLHGILLNNISTNKICHKN
jgi:hypothetical protein